MNKVCRVFLPLLLCSLIISAPSLWASWIEEGVPLCLASDNQEIPKLVSDGTGGAIVVWQDYRSGTNYDICVQRIDVSGTVRWTIDGIPLCTAAGNQEVPQITSDGAGGAIITWKDKRGGDPDVYAQRIDAWGTVLWTTDGVLLCTAADYQQNPQLTSDGAGGAIVVWQDYRSGVRFDIYAQRIDAGGTVLWTADGIPLCTATNNQIGQQLISDEAGGAIVTWYDYRGGGSDIYSQYVDASGTVQWTKDGIPICQAIQDQFNPQIVSDGAHGVIITWYDYRGGSNYDIYAQRIDASGIIQWMANGVSLCSASGSQYEPQIASDGAAGAIVSWYDTRNGAYDIYAQRIDASGAVQWTPDGVPLCMAPSHQMQPQLIPDGVGGAIATWYDDRGSDRNIYAQRINSSGIAQWTGNGVPLCTATDYQCYPQVTSDGEGGAIITWEDNRGGDRDIYAQQIDSQGRTGYIPPVIHSVEDVPGDEGGCVNLAWEASPFDYLLGEITEYTVWRALDTTAALGMLSRGASLLSNQAELEAKPVEMGKPILRLASLNGEIFYWKLISTLTAYHLTGYSEIAATLFDSTAVCDDYHYFQVIAHTSDPMVFYISDPDSGYSVDNLSPCPPAMLAGEQFYDPAGLQLTWQPNNEPDIDRYKVYRGLSEEFVPGPGNFLDSPCDTMLFDDEWNWADGYHYKVSALDIHGNESGYAMLEPSQITGEEEPKNPAAAYLRQNFPNPFNPSTTIEFGLERRSSVSLGVYDAAGRLVRVILDEERPSGRYEEVWDGRDGGGRAVSSGVYFYRLETGSLTRTRKMILLK
ncbi:MAG: T9SS type A sorting domain-containing protein [Candidatus Krumholzibacteriota bacterium]|nr:T9SS type A sorting domain-containing protein [Candidatus Krumholzibacteriota bacterium]